MEKITNVENEWDEMVEADMVEGPVEGVQNYSFSVQNYSFVHLQLVLQPYLLLPSHPTHFPHS